MENKSRNFLDGTTRKQYFEQEPPTITVNPFSSDKYLLQILNRVFAKEPLHQKEIMEDLDRFASRTMEGGDVLELSKRAYQENNLPILKKWNGWGTQIDEILTCEEWKRLHDVAANEGLIATAYERKHGHYSRLHQLLKLMLFSPASAVVTCPLAMTDASARLIEMLQKSGKSGEELDEHLRCLLSRDEKTFITAAQWMTERTGGSDVGNSETLATLKNGKNYILNGYKYFTSATTANITFALARIVNEKGEGVKGSRGLSLFCTEVTNKKTGKFNNIIVHRLKDKIGTKPLPTAELELVNKPALLIGEVGEGVKTISTLFNLTRIHCVVANVGAMKTMIMLMRDYAEKRRAFGKKLSQLPLHLNTLSDCEVQYRALLQLLVEEGVIMGKVEVEGPHSKNGEYYDSLLRIITPLGKMMSGIVSSEMLLDGCESFGGAGYMNDTGFFTIFTDSFVNRIWEGTSNIMSLDVLRCLTKEPESMVAFFEFVNKNLEKASQTQNEKLIHLTSLINQTIQSLHLFLKQTKGSNMKTVESSSKNFSLTLANVLISSLLVRHAVWSEDPEDIFVLERWIELRPLNRLVGGVEERSPFVSSLALGVNALPALSRFVEGDRIPSKL